jgi:hypothetical protein
MEAIFSTTEGNPNSSKLALRGCPAHGGDPSRSTGGATNPESPCFGSTNWPDSLYKIHRDEPCPRQSVTWLNNGA